MIDWKSKISNDNKFVDLQGVPRYNLSYSDNPDTVKIYEYDIPLPESPPDEAIINFGLPEDQQIFRRTLIPKQVRYPEKDYGRENWTQREVDDFIDEEWHRRRNGIWVWIKGRKFYIPGILYIKMNYWVNDKKIPFIYKYSDWQFFMFWLFCLNDEKCKGIVDFKCRQVGSTENAIIIMWEFGSRTRGAMCVNQSCINENHAIQTYKRLVHGHKNMVYYFRPLNQGTEDPKKGLVLRYPAQHITHTSIKGRAEKGELVNRSSKEDYEHPELGSEFRYGPSKSNEFDGYTIGRAYLDEFAKSDGKINPVEWIQVISEATYSNIIGRKMGMILMTSTAEDIGPDSLQWAQTIWRESDPAKRNEAGMTTNGLYRCFRNVVDRGAVDHWGFPKSDEIIATIKSTYNAMIAAGNTRGAISYMRKNAITIEDVFKSASNESQFDVEKMAAREFYLSEVASPKPWVRGNLKWKDGVKDTEVIWEPTSTGRWLISKHPEDFGLVSNAKSPGVVSYKPANSYYFSAGVDPIDQSLTLETDEKRSKLGMAVMRRFDPLVDHEEALYHQKDDDIKGVRRGDPMDFGANHKTNRFVCTYLNRDNDVSNNFEDVILTAVYFGTDFLPEKNKFGALNTYLQSRGYDLYVADKPSNNKNYKGQVEKDGVTATVQSFNDVFSHIETYIAKYCNAIDHPDLLKDWMTMNWKNRTEKDLGVAGGWALYNSYKIISAPKTQEFQESLEHWEENLV